MLVPSIFGENLLDGFFDEFARPAKRSSFRIGVPSSSVMKTDVKETDSAYELEIELPGYKKEDVKAELKEGYLTISALKAENKDEQDQNGNYIRRERYAGSVSRSFYVGEIVEKEDIEAKFSDGILFVTVPKKEAKPEAEEDHRILIA